jgi:hypothetical protein
LTHNFESQRQLTSETTQPDAQARCIHVSEATI